ncbi:hypothetical protein Taro_010331 [Colocasia esculenta]|uniref:Uncharacterized protein n=1 Tax=Colocasia esculenta TaxID=4460 RepID=A0A843U2R4_COLES|nr:hypothetical protein [Colocasia esculenta]
MAVVGREKSGEQGSWGRAATDLPQACSSAGWQEIAVADKVLQRKWERPAGTAGSGGHAAALP